MTSFDPPHVCPGCSYKLKYLRALFFLFLHGSDPPANATQLTEPPSLIRPWNSLITKYCPPFFFRCCRCHFSSIFVVIFEWSRQLKQKSKQKPNLPFFPDAAQQSRSKQIVHLNPFTRGRQLIPRRLRSALLKLSSWDPCVLRREVKRRWKKNKKTTTIYNFLLSVGVCQGEHLSPSRSEGRKKRKEKHSLKDSCILGGGTHLLV